jgi:Leucine-rich repeat (LRR) protein
LKSFIFSKAILLCFFVFAISSASAQYASIPDSSFRQALIRLGYGSCFDSTHMMIDTTCTSVLTAYSINVGVSSILDLTGIRYFKNLRYLNCYHNPFTFLPALPDSLTTLISYDGQLTFIPMLPNTIRYLNLGDNSLTNLTNMPDSLRFFSFENNLVSVLPPLPAYLSYLSCFGNELSALPALPSSLTYLDCGTNMIDSLPSLPSTLIDLACGVNHITSMPALPNTLQHLFCNNNLLTTLPTLPDSLQRLYCFGNLLTGLPALPESLAWLDCSYNQLSTLPTLPDSMYSFVCRVNMSLHCLPQLKTIVYFTYDSTGLACIPDNPTGNSTSTPALGSLPLCTFANANGCLAYIDGLTTVSDNNFSIYPNPAYDHITVRMTGNNGVGNYTISDPEGRVLQSGLLGQSTTINISSLNIGLYLLNVGDQVYKIIKD